jgi:uncharacterized membrane protein
MPFASALIYGIISMLAWGLTSYWGPLTSRKIGSLETVMLTRILALVMIAVVFFAFLYKPAPISAYDWILGLITGFLVVLATVAYYQSTKKGHIAIFSVVSNSWAPILSP